MPPELLEIDAARAAGNGRRRLLALLVDPAERLLQLRLLPRLVAEADRLRAGLLRILAVVDVDADPRLPSRREAGVGAVQRRLWLA